MKKVVSFSLYGNVPCYQVGAIVNVLEVKRLLPDWICRFYTTDSACVKDQLRYLGAEVVDMSKDPLVKAKRFWRFLAVDDPDVESVISRDADSVVSTRELPCIDRWLNSEEKWEFLVIRDHPAHLSVPMLAGMWGYTKLEKNFVNFSKKTMRSFISDDWIKKLKQSVHKIQDDQKFLKWFYENYAKKAPGPSTHPGKGILRYGPQGHKIPQHDGTRYTDHVGCTTFKGANYSGRNINGCDKDWYKAQKWPWWNF